jgi:hypothetical protein
MGAYIFWFYDLSCDEWNGSAAFIMENGNVAWSMTGQELNNLGIFCEMNWYTSFGDIPCNDNILIDQADLDQDGVVGVSDLIIFIGEFGQ